MITYLAGQRHFVDHLAPIHKETGGQFYVTHDLMDYAIAKIGSSGEAREPSTIRDVEHNLGPIVVASYGDLKRIRSTYRPIALLNHGVGQVFIDTPHESYSGGPGRGRVDLFLETNEYAASHTRVSYPNAQIEVCGSPKMDKWSNRPFSRHNPTIAISFHWDGKVCPETRSAWPHYSAEALRMLVEAFPGRVLGHGHPKIFNELVPEYVKAGIEPVRDFDDIMTRADIYIIDGVSTLYEFAYTDRPTVVLNAPWFRRDVEHGLRFWEYADVGVNVDHPEDLIAGVHEALRDTPEQRAKRHRAVEALYPHRGVASLRAAQAIRALEVAYAEEHEVIQVT